MKRQLNYSNVNIVVMLCRNALELTKRAVESIVAQDIPVQLRIVDNGSDDGTKEWLDSAGLWHDRFIPPLGVSSGWNYLLTDAFRVTDHVLVVNNDVVLRPETYRMLLAENAPFVTAASVVEESRLMEPWVNSPRPHPDFSCFLMRKSVWEIVGPFDQSMVLYAGDCDYHVRMHRAGIQAYNIGIPFYHYASGTLKQASAWDRQRITTQADKDRSTFEAKYGCRPGTPAYADLFAGQDAIQGGVR